MSAKRLSDAEDDAPEMAQDVEPKVEQSKSKSQAPSVTYPDGGLQAWLTVLGAWLTTFCTYGYVNAFGIYQDYYTRIYLTNKSASGISWIGSMQLFFLYAFALPSGILFDLGYFKYTTLFGLALFSFSHFMLSLAKEDQYYQIFLSQGVGIGVAMGFLFLPPLNLIAHYFRRRRFLAMGITVTGSCCGGIVFPIMLNKLLENPNIGFAWAVRACALLILVCLTIAFFLMKTRLPNRKEKEALGLKTEKPDVMGNLTDPAFILTSLGFFLISLGLFLPGFYLQLFCIKHGINSTLAFYTVAFMNAGSIPGRILPNLFADMYGPYNILIISCAAAGGLIFAMFGATTPGGVIAFTTLYGFASGAYASVSTPALISLSTSINQIGIRSGLNFFSSSVAVLIGTPINGALLGDKYAWERPIIFSGAAVLLGTVCIFGAREIAVKRRGTLIV